MYSRILSGVQTGSRGGRIGRSSSPVAPNRTSRSFLRIADGSRGASLPLAFGLRSSSRWTVASFSSTSSPSATCLPVLLPLAHSFFRWTVSTNVSNRRRHSTDRMCESMALASGQKNIVLAFWYSLCVRPNASGCRFSQSNMPSCSGVNVSHTPTAYCPGSTASSDMNQARNMDAAGLSLQSAFSFKIRSHRGSCGPAATTVL